MDDYLYKYTKVYELDTSKTYYIKTDTGYSAVRWCTGRHGVSSNAGPGW